jgi:hypothetical protein
MSTAYRGLGCLLLPFLFGCNTVGPKAIEGARVEYNTAIANSWNDQLLLNLVRMRYGEHPVFLELTSLSTQYNLSIGAQIEPIFDRPDQNIVTRSIGNTGISRSKGTRPGSEDEYQNGVNFNYYERPTVTYSPLQGQTYVSQILTPISLDSIVLLLGSGWGLERVFSTCVQRLNGLPNAPGASGPAPAAVPRVHEFSRAMKLIGDLNDEDVIAPQFRPIENTGRIFLIFRPETANDERVGQLRELLKLSPDQSEFMISNTWAGTYEGVIGMESRSLLGVLYYLSLGVDVPAEHFARGWVRETIGEDGKPFDWIAMLESQIRVLSSANRPGDAYSSVRYGGYWYYIQRSDVTSKVTLSFLSTLFYLQAGDIESKGPLLTLPVN